jgi:hypothetical protein
LRHFPTTASRWKRSQPVIVLPSASAAARHSSNCPGRPSRINVDRCVCAPLGPDGFFRFTVATSGELGQLALCVEDRFRYASALRGRRARLEFSAEVVDLGAEGFCLSRHRCDLYIRAAYPRGKTNLPPPRFGHA